MGVKRKMGGGAGRGYGMGPGADGFARHAKMGRPDGPGAGPAVGRDQSRGGDVYGLRDRIIVAGDERPSVWSSKNLPTLIS
jgi:hypothetical protein